MMQKVRYSRNAYLGGWTITHSFCLSFFGWMTSTVHQNHRNYQSIISQLLYLITILASLRLQPRFYWLGITTAPYLLCALHFGCNRYYQTTFGPYRCHSSLRLPITKSVQQMLFFFFWQSVLFKKFKLCKAHKYMCMYELCEILLESGYYFMLWIF